MRRVAGLHLNIAHSCPIVCNDKADRSLARNCRRWCRSGNHEREGHGGRVSPFFKSMPPPFGWRRAIALTAALNLVLTNNLTPWPTLAGTGFRNRAARAAFHRNGMDVGNAFDRPRLIITGPDRPSPPLRSTLRLVAHSFGHCHEFSGARGGYPRPACSRWSKRSYRAVFAAGRAEHLVTNIVVFAQWFWNLDTVMNPPCAVFIPRAPPTSSFLR